MPYRFRLRPLLKHREFKLQEARCAFGAAESRRMEIEANVGRVRERIRVLSERFELEQQQGIDSARYLYFRNYLDFQERELLRLCAELEKAAREAGARRQAMVECNKSVQVLENVESRERDRYRLAQAHKEQKALDEIAVFKDYRDRGASERRKER